MAPLPSSTDGDVDRQLHVIVSSVILMAASFVGISLRLYTRLTVLRKVFTEDVLAMLGTVTAIGLSTTYTIAAYHGFGKHIDTINPTDFQLLHIAGFTALALYTLTALLVKMSFLVLYLRLDQRKQMRWAVYTLMFAVVTLNISFLVIQIFTCTPPGMGWMPFSTDNQRCWTVSSIQLFYNAVGIVSVAVDSAIVAVPLFMLHSLELPSHQKVGVGALFAVGIIPIIGGCLKCYYVWDIVASSDITYDSVAAAILAQIELHLAILCGSASTFKALFKDVFPSCCKSGDLTEDPFPEHRGGVQGPLTPWPEDDKFESSPTDSESSWQSWSHSHTAEPPDRDRKGPLRPHRVVLSRKPSNVALMPADLQLRFPTIESRLGGHNVAMESVASPRTIDGQQWNVI